CGTGDCASGSAVPLAPLKEQAAQQADLEAFLGGLPTTPLPPPPRELPPRLRAPRRPRALSCPLKSRKHPTSLGAARVRICLDAPLCGATGPVHSAGGCWLPRPPFALRLCAVGAGLSTRSPSPTPALGHLCVFCTGLGLGPD